MRSVLVLVKVASTLSSGWTGDEVHSTVGGPCDDGTEYM